MSEETANEQIEIRSEEVQEILGHIPHWLIRWGIAVIFIAILVFFISSWFFKYPDVIVSSITVITENPPASIIARTNGKIEELSVKDNQKVEEGELLAVIENPADYKDVLALKKDLFKYSNFTLLLTDSLSLLNEIYSLGEIQPFYSSFIKNYNDYINFLKLDYHHKKVEAVNEQMKKVKLYYNRLYNQRNILEKEVTLGQQQYSRDSSLHESKVIADSEFEKAESVFLQKRYSFEGAKTTLANTEIQLSQLEQTILDLQLQFTEQKSKFELIFKESLDNLSSQFSSWEQNYLLKSPISGNVAFTTYWNSNQNVKAGDVVFTIVPTKPSRIVGRVSLPVQGSGKVKVGQQVNIKFLNYPHLEYGMVKGIIKSISLVPSDNNYSVEVILPNGLTSTYGKQLNFKQEMRGTAEIITDDLRLLERIINPIKSALKNNTPLLLLFSALL